VPPAITLSSALDDPSLFVPHFRGDSWNAWKAFLAALFGAPMDDAQLATHRTCTGIPKVRYHGGAKREAEERHLPRDSCAAECKATQSPNS